MMVSNRADNWAGVLKKYLRVNIRLVILQTHPRREGRKNINNPDK